MIRCARCGWMIRTVAAVEEVRSSGLGFFIQYYHPRCAPEELPIKTMDSIMREIDRGISPVAGRKKRVKVGQGKRKGYHIKY